MRLNFNFGFGEKKRGGGGAPPVINPNLLVKTEQFDVSPWTATLATVTPDGHNDPLGHSTADLIEFSALTSRVSQISGTAATSGSGTQMATITDVWARFSVTATLSSGTFTFSVWLLDPLASGFTVSLVLDTSGGLARCTVKDTGDSASLYAWGAKLETGSSPTGDASTYGAA